MKERLEQIKHIENMIRDLNKAINNANQFGDTTTVEAINNQINKYREVLQSLKEEELKEEELKEEELKEEELKEEELKEDKIKVVVKKPGDTHGQIVEIENRLEELQSIVEGYIEVFPLTEDILIILNEEGKLQDLEPNILVSNGGRFELIVGNVVIVADNGEDFGSLNDQQINQLYKLGILDNRHIEDFLNF